MILNNRPLKEIAPNDAANLIAENGYLIIENSGASPEEFIEWNMNIGYHVKPDIWCTDTKHSEYFWRVTNEKVDGENKGLFADDELDWHSNLVPEADAQEIIGLYGKTITYPTETWICSSIPYFSQLSEENKNLFRNLSTRLWHSGGNPMNQPWKPAWNKKYSDEVMQGIKRNRLRSESPIKKSRRVIKEHSLVPDHPLGVEGIFFQPYDIVDFVGVLDSKSLYNEIYKEFIESEKYTYKHVWKEGDILLMDQLTTIHRRPTISKNKTRELLRSACWYKNRKHNKYVL
tara:strand:+ start:5973 stop:6836 length:864 start_codon:yes stop_codon:yes gene_type:complete